MSQPLVTTSPFWEQARNLYDETRDRLSTQRDEDSADHSDLVARMAELSQAMLDSLRQPTRGILTQADLTASASGIVSGEEIDLLMTGDVRLIGDRFRCAGHRPLALLVLDQNIERDEWLVVPFGEGLNAVCEHEWETDMAVPMLHVLCFWNAHWITGAALDNTTLIDQVDGDEVTRFSRLYAAMRDDQPWDEDDLLRSATPITSVLDSRHEYVEREIELMRELTHIKAYRAPVSMDPFQLTASAGTAATTRQQGYLLVGFARELWLNPQPAGLAAALLSAPLSAHAAPLRQPVLVTAGNEYRLLENEAVQIPLDELEQGFCIRMGGYGKATLIELSV